MEIMKPALLVQDIQNVWLYDPDSNQDLRKSVEMRLDIINEAISWFRKNKFPIIVGYTEDKEDGLLPGTERFEVPETVKIEKTDRKATKLHASAFGNPEFGAMLKKEGCDALVIVGLSASGCVLATYFSAPDKRIVSLLRQRVPFRITILILRNGAMTHGEIVHGVRKSPSTVSHHLEKLLAVGVVSRNGNTSEYLISDPARIEKILLRFNPQLTSLTDGFLEIWDDLVI